MSRDTTNVSRTPYDGLPTDITSAPSSGSSELMQTTVSIIIPAHNERGCIPLLCIDLDSVLRGTFDYEIILVDDGSTDETLDEMIAQTERREHVRCLRLATRQGQSAALLAGIRAATGDIVIAMDGDLQYSAEDVPRLVHEMAHADIVLGIRTERADSFVRRISARIGNGVRRTFLRDPFVDICSGLAAYRREWLKDLPPFDGLHRFLPAIVALRGARVQQIEINHRTRRAGKSHYGIIGPAWRGFFDLFGVRWGIRRQVVPSAAQERRGSSLVSTPAVPTPSGTSSFDPVTSELPQLSFPDQETADDDPLPLQTDLLEPADP